MRQALQWRKDTLLREVERRSGAPVSACLQCHKCSTGCPIGREADYSASQIMRLLHLGLEREVLSCQAIWICPTCEACTTRCPMGIDVAGVMDALRILAMERGMAPRDAQATHFGRSFLASVQRHGRVYEMGMMMAYKLRSRDFFSDVDKAPKMFIKGKLALLPHFPKNAGEVREVFRRAEEEEKNR